MGKAFSKMEAKHRDIPNDVQANNEKLAVSEELQKNLETRRTSANNLRYVATPTGNKENSTSSVVMLALYDFSAREDSELSFIKDDYLDVLKEEWFFSEKTRVQANTLLKDPHLSVGTFLVRTSAKKEGHYVICVKASESAGSSNINQGFGDGSRIKHHLINEENDGFYLFNQSFSSIVELVETWKESILQGDTLLTRPCPRSEETLYDLTSQTRDDWEISPNCIKLGDEISSGFYGKVYDGTFVTNRVKVRVAVKTLRPGTMSKDMFLDGAKVMKGLQHHNIVNLFGVCSTKEPYYIITEYMAKGSLLKVLRTELSKVETHPFILYDFALKIADGMSYLEERRLIHRQLACRNVLVDETMNCKIADFGLAKYMEEEIYISGGDEKFPVKWSPPEALLHRQFSIKSDVWSFGITFFEILTFGAIPYPGMDSQETSSRVLAGYRMEMPRNCSKEIGVIINNCWEEDPEKRSSFAAIYKNLSKLLDSRFGYF